MTRSGRFIAVLAGLLAFLVPATVAHSLWSTTATSTFSVTTAAAPVAPPVVPVGFSCSFATFNGKKTVQLSWEIHPSADYYEVIVRRTSGTPRVVLSGITSVPVSITDAQAGTENVDLAVRAVNANGSTVSSSYFNIQFAGEWCRVAKQ